MKMEAGLFNQSKINLIQIMKISYKINPEQHFARFVNF